MSCLSIIYLSPSFKRIKAIVILFTVFLFANVIQAQNSMTGDGFGGRGWYVAHNYSVGAYSAYTICGNNNQLYGWGSNNFGQLGDGTLISSVTPVAVLGMSNVKFYTSGYFSAAIKNDNTGWVWISGHGFTSIPQQVINDVKFVDAGFNHVVFVKNDGTVWGVGENNVGQLGNGNTSSVAVTIPVQMAGITNAVRAVALGLSATVILLRDSTLKITGGGGYFQAANSTIPVKLEGLSNIIDVKGNALGAYALNSSGELYSFGNDINFQGVLGIGNPTNNYIPPTKINFPPGAAPIIAISTNNDGYSCMALDTNRNVYAWGWNAFGQLGNGTNSSQSTPVLVATNVVDILVGETFSYIIKADGTLWATGVSNGGSIWMNLISGQGYVFTQINPVIPPMNLCATKPFGVVPIKLLSFTCTASGIDANLFWESGDEVDFEKYIIEYSLDGIHFQSLTTVASKGSNSKYYYTHSIGSHTIFYRLKMVDRDSSFTYSETRLIKFHGQTTSFSVFPNPSRERISIKSKDDTDIISFQVISLQGEILKNESAYYRGQEISLSKLRAGTYILKVNFKNSKTGYCKFTKI